MTDVEQMIMRQEGTGPMKDGVFYPYKDTTGLLTIGYGHCLDRKGLTLDLAFMLLKMDIGGAIEDAMRLCSIFDELTRPRQLVLISMSYQLGHSGFARFVRFWDAIHREDWDHAAEEMLDSDAARQTPARYAGLIKMMRENKSEWI